MEMKRHSTSQDLVRSEEVVDDDIPTVNSGSIEAIGVDNLAFEKESKQTKARRGDIPVIHFPLPPANRPSSEETSGDGTSDSSIYFPKRPYKFNSVQDLLNGNDEERNKIYSKLRGNMGSEKMKRKELGKATTKKQQQTRQRRKRRVGSMEHDVDVHQADEQDNEFDIGRKSQSIAIVEDERTRRGGGAEAINKDLILQRAGRVVSFAAMFAFFDFNQHLDEAEVGKLNLCNFFFFYFSLSELRREQQHRIVSLHGLNTKFSQV